MKTISAPEKDRYIIEYIVYEYNCPNCGATYEEHIEAEANFFKKEVKCYKCNCIFIAESE